MVVTTSEARPERRNPDLADRRPGRAAIPVARPAVRRTPAEAVARRRLVRTRRGPNHQARLLAESESRFRATFEQAAVGIAHVDLDGRFLRVNDRLCSITGYAREDLLTKTFQEITHPDDLAADLNL